ncbi:hypothetical protein AYO45_04430 [Gammaproteobacteria bacterium SCGC AG-212-F23]|nr:hypothetical protein AYO45_04430 [Gammaproteobacteria bacterium SCGC AG-212-F23]
MTSSGAARHLLPQGEKGLLRRGCGQYKSREGKDMTASMAMIQPNKKNALEEAQTILSECEQKNIPTKDAIYQRLNAAVSKKEFNEKDFLKITAHPQCPVHVLTWYLDVKSSQSPDKENKQIVLREILHRAVESNLAIIDIIVKHKNFGWSKNISNIVQAAIQLPEQKILRKLLEANIPCANGSYYNYSAAMEAWILFYNKKINATQRVKVLKEISSFFSQQGKRMLYSTFDLVEAIRNHWQEVLMEMKFEIEEYKHIDIATVDDFFTDTQFAFERVNVDSLGDYPRFPVKPLEFAARYANDATMDLVLSGKPPHLHYGDPCKPRFIALMIAIYFENKSNVIKLLAAYPDYDLREDKEFIERLSAKRARDSNDRWVIRNYVGARMAAFDNNVALEENYLNATTRVSESDNYYTSLREIQPEYFTLPRPKKPVDRYASMPMPNDEKDFKADAKTSTTTSAASTVVAVSAATSFASIEKQPSWPTLFYHEVQEGNPAVISSLILAPAVF